MRLFGLILVLLVVLLESLHSQEESLSSQENNVYTIHSISFEGLKKSKESYLSQEMVSRVGLTVTDSLLREDVQRLKNLNSINNAEYRIVESGNLTSIVFEVSEVRTLLPIFNFGGITNNIWFQVGAADINWNGTGQILSASYLNNDNRHSANLFFQVPEIKNSGWGFSASIATWRSFEPLFFNDLTINYNYGNDSAGLSLIRKFGFNRYLEFGGTAFIETYSISSDQLSLVAEGIAPERVSQKKILGKVLYKEDFLKQHFFYTDGFAWSLLYQSVYNTLDQTLFNSLQLETKYFKRIGKKVNLANRVRIGLATNDNSPFAPFVADSHVNIRGIGNRIDRGTAQMIVNTEFRYSIHDKTMWPHNKDWGVQLVGFADVGTWRNPGGSLSQLVDPDQFRLFFGGGFRVIYNKVFGAVLRVDYSVDVLDTNIHGIVIGFGQYF